jgi:hypothetical protein
MKRHQIVPAKSVPRAARFFSRIQVPNWGRIGAMAQESNKPAPAVHPDPLLTVCRLLKEHQVKYVLVGARACIIHGLVRSTQDVDLPVEPSPDNLQRVINALIDLPDHAARE